MAPAKAHAGARHAPDDGRQDPVAALRDLLAAYDRANRLLIDAVYAQFSPTLDDYYREELQLVFPAAPDTAGSLIEVRPEIRLTRTVPGQLPRTMYAPGAPFPLARATTLVRRALVARGPSGATTLRHLESGQIRLSLRQAGRSQAIELVIEPPGQPLLPLLAKHA